MTRCCSPLVGRDRLAGVGPFAADATYSNIAGRVAGLDTLVSSDPERILALRPDVVVVSRYTKADLVDLIREAGVPVVRTVLENSAAGNIPNILLLGYLFGAEERALELAAEIERRIGVVAERVPRPGNPSAPACWPSPAMRTPSMPPAAVLPKAASSRRPAA